jgi:hypothetical protein
MLNGRKLGLVLAFTVLIALAFGVSCTGFFPPNSLTAISIQPPSPQIEVGSAFAQTLQAWGTYANTNGTSQITKGVVWTSSDTTVLQIDPNTGLATGVGTGGSATVTASAQGLSATASATVFLGNITGFEVCDGSFGNATSCSTSVTWNPNASTQVTQQFVAQATNPSPPPPELDLTTTATWTVESSISSSISCDNSVSPATCTVAQGTTAGTYIITVTYGTGSTATINVNVSN